MITKSDEPEKNPKCKDEPDLLAENNVVVLSVATGWGKKKKGPKAIRSVDNG